LCLGQLGTHQRVLAQTVNQHIARTRIEQAQVIGEEA
jgi:hypothetical protein